MTLSFALRVSMPDHVWIRELEGGSVLLNLDSGSYFGLDDVGTDMWKALTTSDSLQDAYNGLLEQYDVEPERLREDLHDLIRQLAEHGLLTLKRTQA